MTEEVTKEIIQSEGLKLCVGWRVEGRRQYVLRFFVVWDQPIEEENELVLQSVSRPQYAPPPTLSHAEKCKLSSNSKFPYFHSC